MIDPLSLLCLIGFWVVIPALILTSGNRDA